MICWPPTPLLAQVTGSTPVATSPELRRGAALAHLVELPPGDTEQPLHARVIEDATHGAQPRHAEGFKPWGMAQCQRALRVRPWGACGLWVEVDALLGGEMSGIPPRRWPR